MTRDIIDQHCKAIRDAILNGDTSQVIRLNYLKNNAPCESTKREWQWIGQRLVMSGWLSVNSDNDFIIK